MEIIRYVIKDENGIHARPAGMFVKKAGIYSSDIKIRKDEKSADGKRLFGIMGLGIKCGDEIAVEITGDDEKKAKEGLEEFLKNNL